MKNKLKLRPDFLEKNLILSDKEGKIKVMESEISGFKFTEIVISYEDHLKHMEKIRSGFRPDLITDYPGLLKK